MGRWITWTNKGDQRGWACSACSWDYPIPSLLADPEAKDAYDRLAHAKFEAHDCGMYSLQSKAVVEETLSDRARKLVSRGYKPKDAVELVLQEIQFEHRHEPKRLEKAQREAEEFLRNIRQGRI